MKIFSVLLLLIAFPALVQAQGDEPDLAVSPKRSVRRRPPKPESGKQKPETREATETKVPESQPKRQKVTKQRPSLIQIDREAKKIVTPKIHFLPTKTNLTPLAKKILKQLAHELTTESGLQIQIETHTDELGSDRFNQELSQQQADTVKAFLAESGIANTRLQAVGQGDTKLLEESRTPLAQAKNRRVEFVITGEVAAPTAVETQPETTPAETLPTPPPPLPAETQPETTPTSVLPPPPPTVTPTPTIPVISLPTIPTMPETRP